VDTYPGVKFKGRVDSIMSGTGSAFSLLPPENATGNWVKVVQRISVKIVLLPPLPESKPLRLGMSTEVTIDTRKHTGPRLLPAKP
jgi:membrane fusion protein (multidrug efflux system)